MPDIEFIESGPTPEAASVNGFKLRGRQQEWKDAIHSDLKLYSRCLCVAPGGVGKTTLFAALAADMWANGVRTLVLENRDRLTEQTASRIRKETGLTVDVEKGDQRASPYSPIVVACVQSLSKINRLTCFSEDHFGLVVADECHLALSHSWLRIIRYFHWGSQSLEEDWKQPPDLAYAPKAKLVGFTASPNLGDKRSLGELFHRESVNYPYLDAIDEGWLVGIVEKNIPVKVDCRKFRRTKTAEGAAFNIEDQDAAILPIIKELAAQIPEYAPNRKGIAFVPSLAIARALTEALVAIGVDATFVSGECMDKNEKTDAFASAGPGAWLINACLYTYGVDFPDVSCVAIFGPIISKVKYVQSIYRGTRVLDGTLKEGMNAAERVQAIANSKKTHLLVLSPFYISDRINLCETFDMFGVRGEESKKLNRLTGDLTDTKKVRDYMEALNKAADPHRNRQPRTIDPVRFGLAIGVEAIANYQPQNAQDAAPPTKAELDYLLEAGCSTVDVKTSGAAQLLIQRLQGRERLGLASPKTIQQLTLRLGWPQEAASMMKQRQAGMLVGKGVRYRKPVE